MSAHAIREIGASSLTAELPEGITIFKTKKSVVGNRQKARSRRGIIGWFDVEGMPYRCHRRNNHWYGAEADVARLQPSVEDKGPQQNENPVSEEKFPPGWGAD